MRTLVAEDALVEVELVDDAANSGVAEGPSVFPLTVGGMRSLDGGWEDFSLACPSTVFF